MTALPAPAAATPTRPCPRLALEGLSAGFGDRTILQDVAFEVGGGEVLALIGPTGCGKSTLLRCLNRLHERAPRAWVRGRARLGEADIYGADIDPERLRAVVGMIFSQPNPFPTMSIRDNVLAGLRLTGRLGRRRPDEAAVEGALRRAALWEEVRDRLEQRAGALSAGQQQQLCIARALALGPAALLLDDPCASLDPTATARIEDLIGELKAELTILMATHSLQQAARVSDQTALLFSDGLVEAGPTGEIFTSPRDPRTEDYITGRYAW